MRYFLGVDVGSSKTHALIADETGNCISFGKAGGGNHQGMGYERLTDVLQKAFVAASQISGVEKDQIAGAGFGIAGYDFPSEREAHLQAIAPLGLSCPVEIVNDGSTSTILKDILHHSLSHGSCALITYMLQAKRLTFLTAILNK